MNKYQIVKINPLSCVFSLTNPRTDGETADIEALSASIGADGAYLAQPPIVKSQEDGSYKVLRGERRIRALQQAGIASVEVLVEEHHLSAGEEHRLQVVENLHRETLHPIDWAVALRLQFLYANAVALEAERSFNDLFEQETTPLDIVRKAEQLLEEIGWSKFRPVVSLPDVLNQLGIEQSNNATMKQLRVLNFDAAVIRRLRDLAITEASIRAFARIASTDDQLVLLDALETDSTLISKIRMIANRVKQEKYSIKEAIALAQGRVYFEGSDDTDIDEDGEDHAQGSLASSPKSVLDSGEEDTDTPQNSVSSQQNIQSLRTTIELGETVVEIITLAGELADLLRGLQGQELGDPWGTLLQESILNLKHHMKEVEHVV